MDCVLNGTNVRVLAVDDFLPWLRFEVSMLQELGGVTIVGEVSDGLHAVEKAQALQPDLILLDIGLPALNGIEAFRGIRSFAPESRVLFVSENRSWDIAEECLRIGASGYVVKSDAQHELVPAVQSVLQGKQFVSSSLGAQALARAENLCDTSDSWHKKTLSPLPPRNVPVRHEVAFYSDDAALVQAWARVMKAALDIGNTVVLIATKSHRTNIVKILRREEVDLDAAEANGTYIEVDAIDVLSKIMANDLPNAIRCSTLLNNLIGNLAKATNGRAPRITICGECAPTLLTRGHAKAAVELEHLWNEVTRSHKADTLCGYIWPSFPNKDTESVFQRICAEHSAVHGRELGY
jgi:DNA-binding NarL/FixJ family response regulator